MSAVNIAIDPDSGAATVAWSPVPAPVQCLLCAQMNQCIEDDGYVSEEVGICSLTIQFRALHVYRNCADFAPTPIEPLRVDGCRVGDANENGDGRS